jgi:hypothetical protein
MSDSTRVWADFWCRLGRRLTPCQWWSRLWRGGIRSDGTRLHESTILALEYASDQILRDVANYPTVDIDIATPMTNEAVWDFQEIVKADAEADFLDNLLAVREQEFLLNVREEQKYFIRVFFIDLVFNSMETAFVELHRWNLNQIWDSSLSFLSATICQMSR